MIWSYVPEVLSKDRNLYPLDFNSERMLSLFVNNLLTRANLGSSTLTSSGSKSSAVFAFFFTFKSVKPFVSWDLYLFTVLRYFLFLPMFELSQFYFLLKIFESLFCTPIKYELPISHGPYDFGQRALNYWMMRNIFLSPDPIRNSYTMQRHLPFPSHFSFFSIWHFVIKLSRIDLYFNVSITNLYTFKRTFRGYKGAISWESPEWSLVKSLGK